MDKGKVVEIERRFLLKNPPAKSPDSIIKIDQWYKRETRGVCRWRRSRVFGANQYIYEKIIKLRISPGINSEEHIPITQEIFEQDIPISDKHICKFRNIYNDDGFKYEVDVFSGMRLVICEVELKDINDLFVFPPYIAELIIKEITGESEFDNYNLAQ